MSDELKPCPFCGGDAHKDIDMQLPDGYGNHYVSCENCSVAVAENSEDAAIDAWNTRQQPSEWVSVEDALPEDGQKIWYYFSELGVFAGYYEAETDCYKSQYGFLCGQEVSHWMPRHVPQPPVSVSEQPPKDK